jgi:hypothetical protein
MVGNLSLLAFDAASQVYIEKNLMMAGIIK